MIDAARTPDAQGDLRRYPFPRLLYYLYKKQFLGELEISQPGTLAGRIYFRDGLPVFTDLPFPLDVLGRVLVERGLIREEQLYESLQELATTHKRQGQILLGMGALDSHGLVEGLRLQLLRKLNRVFAIGDAAFRIYSGEHGRGQQSEEALVRADPLWVIYHGVRNSFDTPRMAPELEKLRGQAIGLPPEFEDIRSRYGMGEEMEPLVVLLMRGAVAVERLFQLSNLGPLLTQMLVYTLWVTEALGAASTPAQRARPAQTMPQESEAAAAAASPPVRGMPVEPAPRPARRPASAEAAPVSAPPRSPRATAPSLQSLASAMIGVEAPAGAQAPATLADDDAGAIPLGADDAVPLGADDMDAFPLGADEMDAIPLGADEMEPIALGADEVDGDSGAGGYREEGTPVIRSAPPRDPGLMPAATTGAEGVYEIPAGKAAPVEPVVDLEATLPAEAETEPDPFAAAAPPAEEPLGRVPSSPLGRVPSSPLQRVPSSPFATLTDAGATAKQHQAVRKMFKRLSEENYYDLLELKPTATAEQVKEAYFRLAKDFHPDRAAALGLTDLKRETEEIFRVINEAHTTLTSPEKRAAYDEQIKGGGKKQEVYDAVTAEFTFQKGLVHLRKKNYPEALRHFQEAARLNPNEGEHAAYVAWALYCDPKTNKDVLLPKLKEQLLKAMKLSPNSATCHYFLGEIYAAMNDERRAYTCFDRVLEIQPDHVDAQRHIRIMRMRREKKKDEEKKGLFSRLRKKEKE